MQLLKTWIIALLNQTGQWGAAHHVGRCAYGAFMELFLMLNPTRDTEVTQSNAHRWSGKENIWCFYVTVHDAVAVEMRHSTSQLPYKTPQKRLQCSKNGLMSNTWLNTAKISLVASSKPSTELDEHFRSLMIVSQSLRSANSITMQNSLRAFSKQSR